MKQTGTGHVNSHLLRNSKGSGDGNEFPANKPGHVLVMRRRSIGDSRWRRTAKKLLFSIRNSKTRMKN